mmetsp:Transcript_3516/g.7781  ORF Transcript_3516/g.7781 Transcript_3516/m.7781 type:complete len:237 (+) Transcript_3516:2847-3557(+)
MQRHVLDIFDKIQFGTLRHHVNIAASHAHLRCTQVTQNCQRLSTTCSRKLNIHVLLCHCFPRLAHRLHHFVLPNSCRERDSREHPFAFLRRFRTLLYPRLLNFSNVFSIISGIMLSTFTMITITIGIKIMITSFATAVSFFAPAISKMLRARAGIRLVSAYTVSAGTGNVGGVGNAVHAEARLGPSEHVELDCLTDTALASRPCSGQDRSTECAYIYEQLSARAEALAVTCLRQHP